jgi:rRNA-processing protein FCF1
MTIDEDELMEWEPIEDDKILSHIQEVRIQIQHDDKSIQKLDYGMIPIFSASGQQEWFIVLDSNVLISNVKYVEELRDTNVKGLGFPVLVIPWQVLQELDVMKNQGRVKRNLLAARARRAISFLHSNFTSQHPRVRGQTALDAISKDFKIEVPDDAILHCCLQIAQKTNQVILLSNDKNLCNKAIVNGIRAYKMGEIQQALQEWGTECSLGNVLVDVMPVDKAVPLVESVQCRLKLLLKELLSRVVENEMIKVYDTSWKRIVVIKPPWTLSDILICMRKHWIGVFGFVMPAEAKPILECLSGFFGNITQSKGYGHSLSDVKAVIQQSLRLCMLIRSEDYLELVSRCVTDIEVLQKHCEETGSAVTKKNEEVKSLVKNEAQRGDIQSVIDALKECWNSVYFFCAVMCDVLGIEHHMLYNRPQILPTPDTIRENLPRYCHSIHALIKNIIRIRELPMSVLTVDHEAVKNFFLTLTNFLPSEEGEEKINPELILKFCTTESTRSMLETAQVMLQEMGVILYRGMNYFVQCDTC